MADYSTDPFSQVLNALWDHLEAHSGFAGVVKLANRIKVNQGDEDPYRREVQAGDLPEAVIEPAGGEVQIAATSTSARALQRFALVITTGTLRTNAQLFPIKWQLMKALHTADDNLGLDFVRKLRISDVMDSREDVEWKRGTKGWTVTLTVDVEIWIANSDLES